MVQRHLDGHVETRNQRKGSGGVHGGIRTERDFRFDGRDFHIVQFFTSITKSETLDPENKHSKWNFTLFSPEFAIQYDGKLAFGRHP